MTLILGIIDPLEYSSSALTWMRDHVEIVMLASGAFLGAAFLYYLALEATKIKWGPKRDAVKRALRASRRVAATSGIRPKELWTTGNRDVPPRCWGRIVGLRETASARWIVTRPKRGVGRFFKKHMFLVANHLVPDTVGDRLEVVALGMGSQGPVMVPDDDLSDPRVIQAWREVLQREGIDTDGRADLTGKINRWYNLLIRLEVVRHQSVEALDDEMLNWRISMATFVQDPNVTKVTGRRVSDEDSHSNDRAQERDAHA